MARQEDIRYINSFVSGNVAYQIEPKENRPSITAQLPKLPKQPKVRERKELQLIVEPVALVGVVLAAVLLVMLAVGALQLMDARADERIMEQYVQSLREENTRLQDTYHSGYDLERVEEIALAMGMVPVEEVEHIQVSLAMPVETPEIQEPGFWTRVLTFLTGLCA